MHNLLYSLFQTRSKWGGRKKRQKQIKYLSLKTFLLKQLFLNYNLHTVKFTCFKHTIQRFSVNSSSCATITTIQLQNISITSVRPLLPESCARFQRCHSLSTSHWVWTPCPLPLTQLNMTYLQKPERCKLRGWPKDPSWKGSTCFSTTTLAAEGPSEILLWLIRPKQDQQISTSISDPLPRPHS